MSSTPLKFRMFIFRIPVALIWASLIVQGGFVPTVVSPVFGTALAGFSDPLVEAAPGS